MKSANWSAEVDFKPNKIASGIGWLLGEIIGSFILGASIAIAFLIAKFLF